jgi:hypothetical protein
MARSPNRAIGALAVAFLTLAPAVVRSTATDSAAQPAADDAYPADIAPPAGTQYPCALTALPRDLPGIPETDRAYINRTYSRLLRATQAKLVLLKALDERRDVLGAQRRYADLVVPLAERQAGDAVPAGLAPFQEDVREAVRLQQTFFAKAAPMRENGRTMTEVYQLPEGRQASSRLISAWGRMQARYPAWSPATKDSVYHHLCALDLF